MTQNLDGDKNETRRKNHNKNSYRGKFHQNIPWKFVSVSTAPLIYKFYMENLKKKV